MEVEGDSAQARMEARRVKGTKASLPLEQYAGTYVDSLYGKAVVTYENGALRLRTELEAGRQHGALAVRHVQGELGRRVAGKLVGDVRGRRGWKTG
jgi:hypothetical protein